ncbi:MAG TPA: SMI1/KNR4 family protein [Verrucomicrobiae bacterium]|nr:SMI1/KNR4 family protein [Verrucomicrobiae bacterium]
MILTQIVPPPVHPTYNGRAEDWDVIQRILEVQLPDDFKKLINIYGTGCFLRFLYLLSPFAPFDTSLNLLSGDTKQLLSNYKSGQKQFPQYSPPFPVYPHESGLFPWAITVNGDTLFWLRQGSPNEWPIVVCDSKFSESYDRFNCTTAEFLCRLFSGKISPKVFPDDLLTMKLEFVPI